VRLKRLEDLRTLHTCIAKFAGAVMQQRDPPGQLLRVAGNFLLQRLGQVLQIETEESRALDLASYKIARLHA